MPFIGELEYKKSDSKAESFAGRPFYVLTKAFAYKNDDVKKDFIIKCPKGFTTDFASIPEWITFLDPKDPRWQRAAVIHDQACRSAREGIITMKEADAYLYYAMLDCGASKLQAYTFWAWVSAKHLIFNPIKSIIAE